MLQHPGQLNGILNVQDLLSSDCYSISTINSRGIDGKGGRELVLNVEYMSLGGSGGGGPRPSSWYSLTARPKLGGVFALGLRRTGGGVVILLCCAF